MVESVYVNCVVIRNMECSLGVCMQCTLCGTPNVSNFTFFGSFCSFPGLCVPCFAVCTVSVCFVCLFLLWSCVNLLSVSCVALRRNRFETESLSDTQEMCALWLSFECAGTGSRRGVL